MPSMPATLQVASLTFKSSVPESAMTGIYDFFVSLGPGFGQVDDQKTVFQAGRYFFYSYPNSKVQGQASLRGAYFNRLCSG
jgi:hypothetical protein